MFGWQARTYLDLLWCIEGSAVFARSLLNHVFLMWFSEYFLWKFMERIWRCFLCGFGEGFTHEYLETLFLVIPPFKSVEKSFDLVDFGWTRGEVFLRVDFQFRMIRWVLGLDLLATGCPWGTPSSPKVSLQSVGWIGRSGEEKLEFFPRVLFLGRAV